MLCTNYTTACGSRPIFDSVFKLSISISISILLFIHGSPSGKRPDLQGAMLKKKKKRLSYLQLKECNINNKWNKKVNTSKY